MFFHLDDMEKSKKFVSLQESFNLEKNILNKEEIISKKLEEKATMLTRGYLKRFETFLNRYKDLTGSIEELKKQHNIYSGMRVQEEKAIMRRQNCIEDENRQLKAKNTELQALYKRYSEKVEEIEKI